MLDPLQIPILLKAIDFIFDEGHRILQERRERRKLANTPLPAGDPVVPNEVIPVEPVEEQKEVRQDLIGSKVDELLWQSHEQEVNHLVRLLETYSRNYNLASEQYAKWGSALVPPIIVNNMTDAENAMIETIRKLEVVLSKVYKKDIQPIE